MKGTVSGYEILVISHSPPEWACLGLYVYINSHDEVCVYGQVCARPCETHTTPVCSGLVSSYHFFSGNTGMVKECWSTACKSLHLYNPEKYGCREKCVCEKACR